MDLVEEKKENQKINKQLSGSIAPQKPLDNNALHGEHATIILYATRSGNAKAVAELAHKYYHQHGLSHAFSDVADFAPENLARFNNLLMVVSTDGEGEPPPSAENFYNAISADSMPALSNLKYAVCALGDSSYEYFCEAGRQMDRLLQQLDAKPFYLRMECDVEFSNAAIAWIKETYQHLIGANGQYSKNDASLFIPKKPSFTAVLSKKRLLSSYNAEVPCYHLELAHESGSFHYQPGDSIELKPENPLWLVNEILKVTRAERDTFTGQNKTLQEMLLKELELTTLSEQTLKNYQLKTGNQQLYNLLQDRSKLTEFISKAHVLDLLLEYNTSLPAENLADILPPIRYRQYSIASCPEYAGSDIHLMIKPVNKNYNGKKHEGAASTYLCNFLIKDQPFQFRHYPNAGFHMPAETEALLIMIANGTGLAPFRAFLQRREALGLKGNTWLVFGEKYRDADFYYKEEILDFQQKGVLERLDLAFSRENAHKNYVQHAIMEKSGEIIRWIQKGAHMYVCGSLKMGKSMKETMNNILSGQQIERLFKVQDLMALKRYHEDVY